MKENDNIAPMPKRTLSASNWLTPITNQANVAVRLGEAFGKEAHDYVWHCADADWEDRARKYVNLVYGSHYGTRWIPDDRLPAGINNTDRLDDSRPPGHSRTGRMVHPSYGVITPEYTPDDPTIPAATSLHSPFIDQVSAQHPSPTPLAGLIRFIGGDGK